MNGWVPKCEIPSLQLTDVNKIIIGIQTVTLVIHLCGTITVMVKYSVHCVFESKDNFKVQQKSKHMW